MAGSSFLLARSPVTPNRTSTHGPATRGILRSRGSRSGFDVMRFLRRLASAHALGAAAAISVLIVSSSSFHDASNFSTPWFSSTVTTSS